MDNTGTINDLQSLKNELIAKVKQIDQTIDTLKAFSSFSFNGNGETSQIAGKYSGYDKKSPMKNRVALVLKTENRFLHMRQIAEILHSLEPATSVKDFVTKLYPAIAELKKAGSIVKFSVGDSNINSFWGSKNWLDVNGRLKKEHLYDEDQVRKFGSEEIQI